ncbi:MAG: hypothetical protein JSV80_05115, partial [Acidobacteriota bacterium]
MNLSRATVRWPTIVLTIVLMLAPSDGPAAAAPLAGSESGSAWDLLLAGEHDAARASFAQALRAEPADLDQAIGLAALLEARGQIDVALDVLADALAKQDASGLMTRGSWLAALELSEDALDGGARCLPLLERLLAGELTSPDPEIVVRARIALGDILRRSGAAERAAEHASERSGLPTLWTLLGPYGHFSRLEMTRVFPPERGDLEPGDDHTPPSAHPPSRLSTRFADGRVFFPDAFLGFGVSYAVADFELSSAAEVLVWVRPTTSARLLLNGNELFAADRWRERPPDAHSARVRLGAGRHRVLLKLPVEDRPPAFLLAIVRAGDGGLVEGLRWVAVDDEAPLAQAQVLSSGQTMESDHAAASAPASEPAAAIAALWWLKQRGLQR